MFLFRIVLPLLGLLLSGGARAQAETGAQLASQLKLPSDAYTLIQKIPALGVQVPQGALQLRTLQPVRGVDREDLRALQEGNPAEFGYRCATALDLVLVPIDTRQASGQQVMDRLAAQTSAQVVRRTPLAAFLVAGTPADPLLVQLWHRAGFVLVASCHTTPLSGRALNVPAYAPVVQAADPAAFVIFNARGTLAWCAPRRRDAVQAVQAYTGGIDDAAPSPDGRYVATYGYDDRSSVKLWRASDARLLATIPTERHPRLLFSGNSKLLFLTSTGNQQPQVSWHDVASGRELGRLSLPLGEGLAAVNADGTRIATRTQARSLRVREVPGGRMLFTVTTPTLSGVSFTRGEEWLVGVDTAGRLLSWSARTGQSGRTATTGIRAANYVLPGPTTGSVTVLAYEGTSVSGAGQTTAFSWSVGSPVRQVSSVERTGPQAVVLGPNGDAGRLQTISFCDINR